MHRMLRDGESLPSSPDILSLTLFWLTARSQIVNAYKEQGYEMLSQAFEDAKFLEKLTGLDKLGEETEGVMESLDWDEDEEESDGGSI